jgi:hypothetical protein
VQRHGHIARDALADRDTDTGRAQTITFPVTRAPAIPGLPSWLQWLPIILSMPGDSGPDEKGRYICEVKCVGRPSSPCNKCPDWIYGMGAGRIVAVAIVKAERNANKHVPPGCYKGHCHPTRCWKNGRPFNDWH